MMKSAPLRAGLPPALLLLPAFLLLTVPLPASSAFAASGGHGSGFSGARMGASRSTGPASSLRSDSSSSAARARAAAVITPFTPPTIIGQTPSYAPEPPVTDSVDGSITTLSPTPNPDSTTFLLGSGGVPGTSNPATTNSTTTGTGNFATTTSATGTAGSSMATAQQQHPGGGGSTVADCMQLWDKTSHMSKVAWRAACVRTLNGIDLPAEGLGLHIAPNGVVGNGVGTGPTSRPAGAGFGVVPGVTPKPATPLP